MRQRVFWCELCPIRHRICVRYGQLDTESWGGKYDQLDTESFGLVYGKIDEESLTWLMKQSSNVKYGQLKSLNVQFDRLSL